MKNLILIFTLFFITMSFSQDIVGKWKTIDDKRNTESSIMEIYKIDGKYYAKIIAILNKDNKDICTSCTGKYKNKNLEGVIVASGLTKVDRTFNGKILDPESDKIYSCYMQLKENDTLKIRGYIGFSLLGRTQYWYRVTNDEATLLINKSKV
ncbi:MAG: DUF2147 domain-containing protein [Flavobacteriaceae bacterium]